MTDSKPTNPRKFFWSKWMVVCAVFVPMLFAFVIYETGVGIPTGTINKGVLLTPPQQIDSLELTDLNGHPYKISEQRHKWHLVVPGTSLCDEACVNALYVTRQVHTRLNEKYTRVDRLFLVSDLDSATAALLKAEHKNIKVAKVDPEAWARLLADTNFERGNYLMMDPDGFLMMYYQDQHTGNDLLADLKRMLKFSREH